MHCDWPCAGKSLHWLIWRRLYTLTYLVKGVHRMNTLTHPTQGISCHLPDEECIWSAHCDLLCTVYKGCTWCMQGVHCNLPCTQCMLGVHCNSFCIGCVHSVQCSLPCTGCTRPYTSTLLMSPKYSANSEMSTVADISTTRRLEKLCTMSRSSTNRKSVWNHNNRRFATN